MTAPRTTIAGIAIPDSALAREATSSHATPPLRGCSTIRGECFSGPRCRAEQLSLRFDAELLYVGTMFHDVGLLDGHRSARER
jgi:hypothetical protein